MTNNPAHPGTPVLLSKYSLEPAPESVSRLATLVAGQGADMAAVSKLIAADRALTHRLLDGDVPASGALEEVERQVFRLGVETILVLAMSEPLLGAVRRTFDTMAGLPLEQMADGDIDPDEVEGFISSLSVTGRANGKVYLRLSVDSARLIAAKVLGIEIADLAGSDVSEVLAELSNMIVGNFKSNLCDAGLPCKLSVPEVEADGVFAPPKVPRGRHRVFGFRHEGMLLLVDILVEFAK